MKSQYDSLKIKEVKVIFDEWTYDPDKKVTLNLFDSISNSILADSKHIRTAGVGMDVEGVYIDIEALKESIYPSRVFTDESQRDQFFHKNMNESSDFKVSIDDSPGIPIRDLETGYVIREGIDEYLYLQWELELEHELNSRAIDEHRELYNQVFGDKNLLRDRFSETDSKIERMNDSKSSRRLNSKLDTLLGNNSSIKGSYSKQQDIKKEKDREDKSI